MRIVYAIFCRSDIKSTTLTMENFVGKGHGPFVPTSVECYALAMVVCEAVGVSMISTPQSNSKHGIPGCDSPASARCGPLRAGPCGMSRCRSNELESKTGKQKFAAYLMPEPAAPGWGFHPGGPGSPSQIQVISFPVFSLLRQVQLTSAHARTSRARPRSPLHPRNAARALDLGTWPLHPSRCRATGRRHPPLPRDRARRRLLGA